MQKVRGHLHSDSTPSWPTDHVARMVCDALMRHCLSDEFEVQHECKLQCPHTFVEVDFGCRLKRITVCLH